MCPDTNIKIISQIIQKHWDSCTVIKYICFFIIINCLLSTLISFYCFPILPKYRNYSGVNDMAIATKVDIHISWHISRSMPKAKTKKRNIIYKKKNLY